MELTRSSAIPATHPPRAERHVWVVAPEDSGQRLDHFLSARLPAHSRASLQRLVDGANVRVDGVPSKSARKVRTGQTVTAEILPLAPLELTPEPAPFDVLYQDEHLAAVNKPAGMIVHPGAGQKSGTLAAALLHRFGSLSSVGGAFRPGIVHRLDKETSGVLVVARTDAAHRALIQLFQSRAIQKTYLALLHGEVSQDSGRIDLHIARDLRRRIRMTTRREGRAALTEWRVLLRLPGFTLVEARLHTGRTHQLRVHFSAIGHPVVGDALYGAPRKIRIAGAIIPPLQRNFLHSWEVRFVHPMTGEHLDVRAPLPPELRTFLLDLASKLSMAPNSIDASLKRYL